MSLKPLRFSLRLFVVAFALNWLWEMLQMPAYGELSKRSWRETAITCTLASLGDALLTLMIYMLLAILIRRAGWPLMGGWKVYLVAALLGAGCAVVVEWMALSNAHWSYTRYMPVVPWLCIGLLPLAQWALLVPAAIKVGAWRHARVSNGEKELFRG